MNFILQRWLNGSKATVREGIEVSDILVTQASLRDKGQIVAMSRFLKTGGVFDEENLGSFAIRNGLKVSPLIEIARFEDGIMAIHNGHHRAIAAFLARGNKKIYSNEFFIRDWSYADYRDIVLPHWVTPFDVLREFRVGDLSPWKKEVREYYVLNGEERTRQFILDNKSKYATNRYFYTVGDMVSRLNLYNLKG